MVMTSETQTIKPKRDELDCSKLKVSAHEKKQESEKTPYGMGENPRKP